jgi:hypothetical protein
MVVRKGACIRPANRVDAVIASRLSPPSDTPPVLKARGDLVTESESEFEAVFGFRLWNPLACE